MGPGDVDWTIIDMMGINLCYSMVVLCNIWVSSKDLSWCLDMRRHERERERGVIVGPNFVIFPNYKSLLSVGSHDSWIMAHKWKFIFLYVNILNISITFL